jgi:hypothetical protein
VKLADKPAQMLLLPVISHTGAALTVRILVHVLIQPFALVTVTVYVPAVVKLLMVAPVAANPPGPVQL